MQPLQNLPIGIQTFSEIREGNFIYIDKTKEALNLIEKYKFVFLSRPRRFGKSLFLDTLQNIFEGKKELFEGLYIYDKYDWDEKCPVIKISFAGNFQTENGLKNAFNKALKYNQENLKITCQKDIDIPTCFHNIIQEAYKKYNQKVVILVDEYDKPLLDNITNKQMADHARDQLKAFYEVIKDNDKYIKFAFLTGVSKFSKVSIFSGLNNLTDITLKSEFGNICGYTHNDIETTFKNHLQSVNLSELKTWYNGYNFLKDKVYNPFDILLFIDENFTYRNYWFETGTPTFLLKLIKEQNYYLPNLENIIVGEEILDSFDINKINIEVLLFQTGYLTIKEQIQVGNRIRYALKIPNQEVQISLNDVVLRMLIENNSSAIKYQDNAYFSLSAGNLEEFKETLTSLFASLPYQSYTKNSLEKFEGYYSNIIYTYLKSLGFPTQVESSTNKGRIDLVIEIENNIYIMEFKVGDENALNQIKEKKYYEKFADKNKQIYLVGINFNEKERNISEFNWEKIS